MATSLTFGGATTRIPTVRVYVDDAGLIPFNGGDQPIVAIVGIGAGGIPKTPTLFSSPAQARELIRSGDLMDGIEYAFRGGAPLVYGVRVNPATQATLTLNDGAAAASVVLTSVNYGAIENLLSVKVETGAVANSKKVTVRNGTASYARDSIIRDLISIQYTGAGSAATLTISATTLSTSVTAGDTAETFSLTLANYPTLQDLYTDLNGRSGYTVTLLATNPAQPVAGKLDFLTAVAIKATAGTISATLEEIVTWINLTQPFVTAARSSGAGVVPANTSGFLYLSGGAEGTTQNSDWQAAIDALELKFVTYLVPITSDAAIHAQVMTHVRAVSDDGTRPRLGVVGAANGEKTSGLTTYLTRARALNSDRMVLTPHALKVAQSDGSVSLLPPYKTAALIAGMLAGVDEIGTSITNAGIAAAGLEWEPTRGDLELGITGGLFMLQSDATSGGYKITRAITTWLQNSAYHRVEIATRVALDETVARVINALSIYLGQKADEITAYRAISTIETLLRGLKEQRIISNFGNISGTVEVAGDTLKVSFEVMPVVSINFIAVTLHASVYTGTFQIINA